MARARSLLVPFILVTAVALAGAGCGGDDDETTTEAPGEAEAAALYDEIGDLPDEEQVTRVGAAWAEPFAAGDEAMCGYLHPDIAGCSDDLLTGALTGSVVVQRSYAGATVTDVKVNGETAIAEFSNGEAVEFQRDPEGEWKIASARDVKGQKAP